MTIKKTLLFYFEKGSGIFHSCRAYLTFKIVKQDKYQKYSGSSKLLYPAISTFAYKYAIRINFCFIRTRRINFSYYTNKLFKLRINFPVTLSLCTAEGADKYETGTNVTQTTKKTPLTTFMKGEE